MYHGVNGVKSNYFRVMYYKGVKRQLRENMEMVENISNIYINK
jgi:hypothetical protein